MTLSTSACWIVPLRQQLEVQVSMAASSRARLRRQIAIISARVTMRKALGPLIGILLRCEVHFRWLPLDVDARPLRNASRHVTKPYGRGVRPCSAPSAAKLPGRVLFREDGAAGRRTPPRSHRVLSEDR